MPRLPDNIEPSNFRRGEYIGYDPRGHVWRIRKATRAWLADPAPNNPAKGIGIRLTGDTLTAVASLIAARQAPRVIEPF